MLHADGLSHKVRPPVPALNILVQVLMSRPREEWVHNIGSRYKALENFTQEDARLQFLRILCSLPYGMHALSGLRNGHFTESVMLLWHLSCSVMCYNLVCNAAGNSTFFFVRRIEDPIALLPNKLILGINKRYARMQRAHTGDCCKRMSTV